MARRTRRDNLIYALLATEDVEPALDDDGRVAEALVR